MGKRMEGVHVPVSMLLISIKHITLTPTFFIAARLTLAIDGMKATH